MGLTQTDKTVSADELFKSLYAHNKRLIERSPRCFIVLNPARVRIRGAPKRSVELDLHPEHHRGGRHLAVHDEFYVSKADLFEFRPGKLYRLMDCLNFHYDKEPSFVDLDYATYKAQGDRIVHWLPVSEKLAAVTVRLPDNTLVKGLGEPRLLGLKEGDLVPAGRVEI